MHSSMLRYSACAFAIIAPSFWWPDAQAANQQNETDQPAAMPNFTMGDIIVTASRRSERLQDVPLSVTALNSQMLETQGINNVGDLGSGKVPGLAINGLFGVETGLAINLRGFGPSDASIATQDMPVAFYVDGINFPRSQGAGLDLVAPERIEILRGPQGQLFGRNAMAGVVQVISKRPTGRMEGDLTVSAGNFDSFVTKGMINLPEMAGFRFQISGVFRRHDGYFKNPYNPNLQHITPAVDPASSFRFKTQNYNGDFGHLKTYGGRIAVERDFGDLKVFYAYDNTWAEDDQSIGWLSRSNQLGTSFNPNAALTGITFTNYSGPGGTPVTFTNALLGKKMPKSAPYGSLNLPFVTTSKGHNLNLSYPVSDAITLQSFTGQREVIRKGGSAHSAVVSPFMSVAYEYVKSRSFSQEFQAIYSSRDFDLTLGAMYFNEKIKDERTSALAYNCLSPLMVVASPTCVPGSSSPVTAPHSLSAFKRSIGETDAYGIYAQGTYRLGALHLIAGLRYSSDRKDASRVIDRKLGIDADNNIGTVRSNRFKLDRVDPAFTIKYDFSDDANVYARYAVGYRDGGSNVRSATFDSFEADEMKAWEIGLKSQWFDQRLNLNLAAFRNEIKNEQVSIQTALPADTSITDTLNNPVDKIVKGVELEAAVHPIEGLTISVNYTYLSVNTSIYGYDFATGEIFKALNSKYSPTTGLVPAADIIAAHPGARVVVHGRQGAPKHAGSIALDYVTEAGPGSLAFHGEWVRSSKYISASPHLYVTDINSSGTGYNIVPVYNAGISRNRVNGRISYRDFQLGDGAVGEISFWVKNLFNHVDSAFLFNSGINSVNVLQPPRTIGVDLRVKF